MVLSGNNTDRRPTCGDCRFYVDGDCHALPPVVVAVGGAAVPVRPAVGSSDIACGWFIPAQKPYNAGGIDPYGKLIPSLD